MSAEVKPFPKRTRRNEHDCRAEQREIEKQERQAERFNARMNKLFQRGLRHSDRMQRSFYV